MLQVCDAGCAEHDQIAIPLLSFAQDFVSRNAFGQLYFDSRMVRPKLLTRSVDHPLGLDPNFFVPLDFRLDLVVNRILEREPLPFQSQMNPRRFHHVHESYVG